MKTVDQMIRRLNRKTKGVSCLKRTRAWSDDLGWYIIIEYINTLRRWYEVHRFASEQEAADALKYANARLRL